MVKLGNLLCYRIYNRGQLIRRTGFFDSLRVFVKGGAGGQGFPRLGGVGGKGGEVFFVANKNQTLRTFKQKNPSKRFVAENGKNSTKRHIVGISRSSLKVGVPVGITVESDKGRVIGELNEEGQTLLVASGGAGGQVDNRYLGQKGEAKSLKLVLKLIADIGLVGFPNAGKSTLLRALSKAKPSVAPLPFTTLHPEIGMMEYPDHRQIKVADLPGLIEGAHNNLGMGHKFLRHIERTKLLLFVVDIRGFQLKMGEEKRSAFETIVLLNKELELYQPEMVNKPAILALNKVENENDQAMAKEVIEMVQQLPDSLDNFDKSLIPHQCMAFDHIMTISAKKRISTDILKDKLRELLDVYAEQQHLLEKQETMAALEELNKFRASLITSTTEQKRKKIV